MRKRRDKAKRHAEARRAKKAENRIGKRYCGTKNWCPKENFNMNQRVCRLHQAHARERRKLARTQQHSSQRKQAAMNQESIAEPNERSPDESNALETSHGEPKLPPAIGTTMPAVDTITPNLPAPTNRAALPMMMPRSRTKLEMHTAVSQACTPTSASFPLKELIQRRRIAKHQIKTAVIACCIPRMEVNLPSVESTSAVTVCWNEEKKWHIRAAVDIPTGSLTAIYPLTIKMQPNWSHTTHTTHTTQNTATQTQYLMPIYETNEQTGRDRIVKSLVGDVSTDAPTEYDGIPCIAHLVNEALKVNQVNVCYVYTTEDDMVASRSRTTVRSVDNTADTGGSRTTCRLWQIIPAHVGRAAPARKDTEEEANGDANINI